MHWLNEQKNHSLYAYENSFEKKNYFHGNLNGNFSVIVLNAFVAILTGSKPIKRKKKIGK